MAESPPSWLGMVGESSAMRQVFRQVRACASLDVPVLIQGETGTGKELVALAIHQLSARRNFPFVDINCAAVPASLFESTFFGHLAGAFTDARVDRKGCFLQAHRGVLFLDEVGELPTDVQAKLLRAIEQNSVTPLGGDRSLRADVRLVSASNVPLDRATSDGRFREDLRWRLCTVTILLPPLRARPDDIPLLVNHLLPLVCTQAGRPIPAISKDAVQQLTQHDWPGNVRELQHVLLEAVLASAGPALLAEDLHLVLHEAHGSHPESETGTDLNLDRNVTSMVRELERALIEKALRRHSTMAAAARALGINEKTLYRKRCQHSIHAAGRRPSK